jgi:hypothetical protein
MANPGERLINIVSHNKPKVLQGLSQNGNGVGTRRLQCLVRGTTTPGGQSAPNPLDITDMEHGNPVRPPRRKATRKASPWTCGQGRMEEAKAIL